MRRPRRRRRVRAPPSRLPRPISPRAGTPRPIRPTLDQPLDSPSLSLPSQRAQTHRLRRGGRRGASQRRRYRGDEADARRAHVGREDHARRQRRAEDRHACQARRVLRPTGRPPRIAPHGHFRPRLHISTPPRQSSARRPRPRRVRRGPHRVVRGSPAASPPSPPRRISSPGRASPSAR